MYMSLRRCERRSPPSSGCARRRASSCCGRSRASRSRSWRRSRHGCASARSRPSRCSSRSRATRARCVCLPLLPLLSSESAPPPSAQTRAHAPPSVLISSLFVTLLSPSSAPRDPCVPVALPGCVGRRAAQARERRRGRRRESARSKGRPGEPSRPEAVAVASGPAKVTDLSALEAVAVASGPAKVVDLAAF